MKKLILITFLLLQSILNAQAPIRGIDNYKVGDVFPDFELKTLDNKIVKSSDLKGKVAFISIWNTHCKPCIEEMPGFNQLKEEYNDRVIFLSISSDSKEKLEIFFKKHTFDFENLHDDHSFLSKTLGVRSVPQNIILDKNGVIDQVFTGGLYIIDEVTNKQKIIDHSFYYEPLSTVLSK